ncbi:hypothetical protein LTR08_008990 [Meristemomyces frigidus]|nr:hypothetical protein LTR08_008990 [Meristemomyces frigidus]
MGCCHSSNSAPADNASSRTIPANPPATAPNNNDPAQLDGDSSGRPNKPIRPPTPIANSPSINFRHPPPWSRSLLDRERAAFFDTRVTGRQEVWDALKVACDFQRQGKVAEAQGILNAANVTTPQGRIAIEKHKHKRPGGVYDERGEIYDVPDWVVVDPQDILEEDEEKDIEGAASDDDESHDTDAGQGLGVPAQQRVEKGKARAESPGSLLHVKARLSDSSADVSFTLASRHPVSVAMREVRQVSGKRVRLMYLGKSLREDKTLLEQGWQRGHVLNAMIDSRDEA